MKLSKLLVTSIITLSIVSCQQGQNKNVSLNTKLDSVSYALGVNFSAQAKGMKKNLKSDFDLDLNVGAFLQGYGNSLDSLNIKINEADSRKLLDTYFKELQKAIGEKNKAAGEAFIAENKTKEGVKVTDSGLQYIVLKEGAGESPKDTDKVKVHYHGTLIDGTVFDSSVDRGEPSEFFVNQVIKGWTEGLQLMKPGAKYKFFVPQELAYGAQQRGAKIKPFSALVFDVELLEIKKKN